MKKIDITGKKFNRWTVLHQVESQKQTKYLCICDCGTEKEVDAFTVRSGKSKSCGCLSSEVAKKQETKHGKTKTSIYTVYMSIKQRCYNKNNHSYKNYGGRGIKMSDEWKNSFEKFYADMGDSPFKKASIDRIDNNKNYSKENCRWATKIEQANNCRSNKVINYNGESKTLMQWCKIYNMPYYLVIQRINVLNWDFEKSILTPKISRRESGLMAWRK